MQTKARDGLPLTPDPSPPKKGTRGEKATRLRRLTEEPMRERPIYLDNHATTRADPRVVAAMLPHFSESYGNAASINHRFGWDARDAVAVARQQVADLLKTDARSVVFTSGATEANNLAIKGVVNAALKTAARVHVVTNVAEHRSVLEPISRLERGGVEVSWLPVDEFGQVSADAVTAALRPETVLVSIMHANNEVGTLNPVAEIAAVCRSRGVLFHCDAVQAAGKVSLDFVGEQFDLLSLSAHKLYGPKGEVALVVRRGSRAARLEPLFDGGGHESHLRSGTLAVPLIVGFGVACSIATEELPTEPARLQELRDRLWQCLSERIEGLHLNGHPTQRLPGNLNISVEGVDGDVLMNAMTEIAVSSGSACTTADPEPSHVLRAMGRSDRLTRASLRFGLGRFTTSDEIDFAGMYVSEQIEMLRAQTR